MWIKFKKSPIGLGYAYKVGSVAASLPDKDAKKLVEQGYADDVTPVKKPPRAKPKDTQVKKAQVKTADIKK
jgi:hypothetical protein